MMKSAFGILFLPFMALATLLTPPSISSNVSTSFFGTNTTNMTKTFVPRQVGPKAYGSSCSDEGAWFCMSNNFQRCALGEWSIVQNCAPGTQCEPLGITHNASQPAFGIYDGNGGTTTTTDARTTTFSIVPVTKTTTADVFVTESLSTSFSVEPSSGKSISTKTGTSAISSSSNIPSPGAPNADTSIGTRMGGLSGSHMCVAFCAWVLVLWRS